MAASSFSPPPPPPSLPSYPLRSHRPPASPRPIIRLPHHLPPPPPPPLPNSLYKPYPPSSNRQVFISLGGMDVGNDFLSLVEEAFINKNINVYCNTERGYTYLQPLFFKRIEKMVLAVVIFSDRYTSSKWCLNELVRINKRMIEGKLHVIPIFYNVDVENVKILAGKFGYNFRETTSKYGDCAGLWLINKWEKALKSIPQKFGLSSFDYRCENDFINAIVEEVEKAFNHITKEEVDVADANRNSNDMVGSDDEHLKTKKVKEDSSKKRNVHTLVPPPPPPPPPLLRAPHPPPTPTPPLPSKHEVFISFEAKDMGNGFLSSVKEAFINKHVNVYVDETELRSRDRQYLSKVIEESIVALVIFSHRYTGSEWYLNELVQINERMSEVKLHVIPIFYKLDVENVKLLAGKFGFNLRETARNCGGCGGNWRKINKWEEALESIPQKFGLSSFDYRCENDFINAIVEEVDKVLNHITKEEADAAEANRIVISD
ncbi:hypothetical protein AALP_AA7G024300 [Arabis alpina]|uniref:TIR domain-containing protein n=1 Tax=Arabis alpina TaxID=50452 RepID=A0A087GFH6_ARAAL|nr:hypothetical protein AALP_AA7G024300 [Arabis alpina]